jgi:hypothetical protein
MFEARILDSYQNGASPFGQTIDILGGYVEMDATAAIRRTVNLIVEGVSRKDLGSLFPAPGRAQLAPYQGREVWVARGISLGDTNKDPLWYPLGYFRLTAAEQIDPPDGEIRLIGQDRMSVLARAKPLKPVQFKKTRTIRSCVEELILAHYPLAQIIFDDPDMPNETIGRDVVLEGPPYEFLWELAMSYGKTLRCNRWGQFEFRTPASAGEPAWRINDEDYGVRLDGRRQVSTGELINGFVITGEGEGLPPTRGVAVDRGPNSPTRWGPIATGNFGMFPEFDSSPLVKTKEQATAAARERLRRKLGEAFSAEWVSVVNPALEEEDLIEISYRDNTTRRHIVDRLTMPLDYITPMTGATREQTLVVIGQPL